MPKSKTVSKSAYVSQANELLYNPVFPKDWGRRSLLSFAEWVNGLAFRNIEFSSTGMPVIKIAEIKGGISRQTKFTKQTFDDSVFVRNGDLLFAWSGQPETSIDAFWWRGDEGWLNQHIFRVSPRKFVVPTFFYYLLKYLNPNFVEIARNKQTTGLGHVTKKDLQNIEAAFPPLPEQRAIAHILGTLDDKIELNRRMNETLEAMARALFKSWFVDFEPGPRQDGRSRYGPAAAHRRRSSPAGSCPRSWERFRRGGRQGSLDGRGRDLIQEEVFDPNHSAETTDALHWARTHASPLEISCDKVEAISSEKVSSQ